MAIRKYSAVTLDIKLQTLNEVDKKQKRPTHNEAIDICTLSHNLEGISNTDLHDEIDL